VIDAFNEPWTGGERPACGVSGQPGILSGGYDPEGDDLSGGVRMHNGRWVARARPCAAELSHPFPVVRGLHRPMLVAKGAFILLSADYRIGVESIQNWPE